MRRCGELCSIIPLAARGTPMIAGVIDSDGAFGGRLKSRDVGWLGEDGYLRVLGRSDHVVKRDGRLVAFAEVEAALLKNELIEAAVVLSDGLTARGARLTAVCVVRDRAADVCGLRDATRQHLPAYAVPDRVVLIDDIPRLESGKPDRATLTQFAAEASS
jgi:acyl-coenzyme A synthetase/AMP-(fatty) acid ligase